MQWCWFGLTRRRRLIVLTPVTLPPAIASPNPQSILQFPAFSTVAISPILSAVSPPLHRAILRAVRVGDLVVVILSRFDNRRGEIWSLVRER